MSSETTATAVLDPAEIGLREVNARLQAASGDPAAPKNWRIVNPAGRHNLAVGLDADIDVNVEGHVGYYCAGMNQRATVRIDGNAGVGVAENMMCGSVEVLGDASQAAGATARGGRLTVHGNASARCAISLKGGDIVVAGSIGHLGAFMAQRGRLVVCGDAGESLGDSIYEARIYVGGKVAGLGADCVEKEMADEHVRELRSLLLSAGLEDVDPSGFRRYGSARRLYNFDIDDAGGFR
jgi:glutamate synthase domain-containing protein 3